MNKVFKVVWSATKNAYVVTSELAKSHQKTATTIVAAILLSASLGGGIASASNNGNNKTNNNGANNLKNKALVRLLLI